MSSNQPPRQPAEREQMARYVLFVDQQAKRSFDSREAAEDEAQKISKAFPIVVVRIANLQQDTVTTIAKPPA